MSRYAIGKIPGRVTTALYHVDALPTGKTAVVPSAYFTSDAEAASFQAYLEMLEQAKPEMVTLAAELVVAA